MADVSRPPTRRPPLGEATRRVNNSQTSQHPPNSYTSDTLSKNDLLQHHQSRKAGGILQGGHNSHIMTNNNVSFDISTTGSPADPQVSAISKESPDSKRDSQISAASTNASDGKKIKSLIGPWRLGKTLGRGATARVRLARHVQTGHEAAVKIVQKKNAQISQAGSLAALDKIISAASESKDGIRRMPIGIEREVAIMKLIEHPNIMKLYDIWENRHEIYLILEYVDQGELFEYIAARGRLSEEEAIKFFRQMLSAVGHCHSLNICHRDLKPENILMTSDGSIKIADFGMAALHQSPGYKLRTSCGSPHYAAPELIKGDKYRGDKTDIWSLGVILFAMLAGRLPFDVDGSAGQDWMHILLNRIKNGQYKMADHFSRPVRDLIQKLLQVNPQNRITMELLWKHPLVRKYDYVDQYDGGLYPSPILNDCGRPVARRKDIDTELMRHLRSMWHTLTEEQLVNALLSETPNDQKMFYNLFLRYRELQLENYVPDGVEYSTSDYHHVKPPGMIKTFSTMHFAPTNNGHVRQASRFTVISNAADTEYSYDPFKASRPQYIGTSATDRAKVTILRGPEEPFRAPVPSRQASRASSNRSKDVYQSRPYASRNSLASSTRSRNSGHIASASYKRGVSFSHLRRRESGSTIFEANSYRHSNYTEVTDDGGDFIRPVAVPASTQYIRSRKGQSIASQPHSDRPRPARSSVLWNEDVRQLSSTLASDCDKAFNRTSTLTEAETVRTSILSDKRVSVSDWNTPTHKSTTLYAKNVELSEQEWLKSRPLPRLPAPSDSVKPYFHATMRHATSSNAPGNKSLQQQDRVTSRTEELALKPSTVADSANRRTLSAPVDKRISSLTRPLEPISEVKEHTLRHDWQKLCNTRIASAPEPRISSRPKESIRLVQPSSPMSPVKVPKPLVVRKISSTPGASPSLSVTTSIGVFENGDIPHENIRKHHRSGLRQQYLADAATKLPGLERIAENHQEINADTVIMRRPGWFKRNSRGSEDSRMSIESATAQKSHALSGEEQQAPGLPLPALPSKKRFRYRIGQLFKKRVPHSDEDALSRSSRHPSILHRASYLTSFAAHDIDDDGTSIQRSSTPTIQLQEVRDRQIDPQQSWLAKLFHVKPAARFICFQTTKRRARQEITKIFKEWRRYGIRDVQIDKERNIVFGKVASKNFLNMKEVAFAGEIMTVIEHGTRSQLSIVRFTQEQGAASSFNKVIDTMETVLRCRGLLVLSEDKKVMMIKTLNSAS